MKYISTRGKTPAASLSEAIAQGLASDGGLFVPEVIPDVFSEIFSEINTKQSLENLNFSEFAYQVLKPFFKNDKLAPHLENICAKAFNFPVPLVTLDSQTSVLELFHGPTNAFKDFGARFLALCIDKSESTSLSKKMVLVATSGDTGGAVAAAFSEFTDIPVTILYPNDRISVRQEKQLTSWGPQVKAFAVDGTFDDCQCLVKQAFQSDLWRKNYHLLSANSINIARLLPQMAYYCYASLKYKLLHGTEAGFIIPSGNIGNGTAALWAQQVGFPIHQIIFSHNANRSVPDYLQNGSWAPQPTISTLANAMDVGTPSNMERVFHLFPSVSELRKHLSAQSVSDQSIAATIKSCKEQGWGYIFCPHTATAAYTRSLQKQGHWILVATADPAKFDSVIEPLLGQTLPIPASLQKILSLPSVRCEISADLLSLQKQVLFDL